MGASFCGEARAMSKPEANGLGLIWLHGQDSNLRPIG